MGTSTLGHIELFWHLQHWLILAEPWHIRVFVVASIAFSAPQKYIRASVFGMFFFFFFSSFLNVLAVDAPRIKAAKDHDKNVSEH